MCGIKKTSQYSIVIFVQLLIILFLLHREQSVRIQHAPSEFTTEWFRRPVVVKVDFVSNEHFINKSGHSIAPQPNAETVIARGVHLRISEKVVNTSGSKPPLISASSVSLLSAKQCLAEVAARYNSADTTTSKTDVVWCTTTQAASSVVIGRSWGKLTGPKRKQWEDRKCNELIGTGALQSCGQRYGWSFIDQWRANAVSVVTGASNVTCASNLKASSFCKYENVLMDLSKMTTKMGSRSFQDEFITGIGGKTTLAHAYPVVGAYSRAGSDKTSSIKQMHSQCDIIETRPTFVLSNDDIFNLCHYYNDLMGVWGMLALSQVNAQGAVLLNMDGWRERGPAGVGDHRIMIPGSPDEHGPFVEIYKSWFAEVQKTKDFGAKKVCYKELYFPPKPGVPWIWNDWTRTNECAAQAASPLYQSYNLFMRRQWAKKYGALPNPPTDRVHVVIEVRAIDEKKQRSQSAARHIANLAALLRALDSIPGVVVTAQDFALIPFAEQVALAHSSGVFVAMHGAGTTHIFHSALGQPNCCALVELFPDKSAPFHTIKAFGNLAGMLGMPHFPIYAGEGKTGPSGTIVDIDAIKSAVEKAAKSIQKTPTCLHDAKETF